MYLAHEVGNDAVEGGTLEAVSLLAGAQSTKVLGGLWDNISTQLHGDSSSGLATNSDIEENLWVCHK